MSRGLKDIRQIVLRYSVPVFAVAAAQMFTDNFWPQAAEAVSLSLFFAAVMVSAWYGGSGPGLLASLLALVANKFFDAPYGQPDLSGAHIVQVTVFLFATLLISLLNGVRQRLNRELAESLTRVKLLSGLLPICSSCKMIRDGEDRWSHIEAYISAHSEATFTHGVCPDCYRKVFPDSYEKYIQRHLEKGLGNS